MFGMAVLNLVQIPEVCAHASSGVVERFIFVLLWLAGKLHERGGVGFEAVENLDARIKLLRSEQGLDIQIGAPGGVFVVVVNGGCDLLVLAELIGGAVGILRTVDHYTGSLGKCSGVLGQR